MKKTVFAFRSRRAETAYEWLKRLYFTVMIAYLPVLVMFAVIEDLRPYPGFIDLGFGITLLMYLMLFGPIFLILFAGGLLVRYILLKRVGVKEVEEEETAAYRLRKAKNAVTVTVVTVLAAAFLLIPYETIHYADGGTVKIEALTYTVMKWNRTETWDGQPIHEPGQRTRVYFFPQNLLGYDEMWELRH